MYIKFILTFIITTDIFIMPQYEEEYENSDYSNSDKFIGADSMGALNGHVTNLIHSS
jgi:hypothetical protein